jgi:hypothetical protein
VAERFRYLLETRGLSRPDFVAALDGAVSEKTLYALLDGTRRPGRALAVLIERTFGFRAEFLLEGTGAMWARKAGERESGHAPELSPVEARVIAFMRRSVDNARELEENLERAELWELLFAHTVSMLRELEACLESEDTAVRARYPAFVRLAYDECMFAAEVFSRYVGLYHKKRVHRLTDRFVRRFVLHLGAGSLSTARREQLLDLFAPVRRQRAEVFSALEASIVALRLSLTRVVELGSPVPLLSEEDQAQRGNERIAQELTELAGDRALTQAQRKRLKRLSEELSVDSARDTFARRMQRMAFGLVSELDHRVLLEVPLSLAELEERRRSVIERLRGL